MICCKEITLSIVQFDTPELREQMLEDYLNKYPNIISVSVCKTSCEFIYLITYETKV